jgi:hypothetical protein
VSSEGSDACGVVVPPPFLAGTAAAGAATGAEDGGATGTVKTGAPRESVAVPLRFPNTRPSVSVRRVLPRAW